MPTKDMPAKGMPTKPETYADYKARIDAALTASGVANNPIVLSRDVPVATLKDLQGVERTPIAWLLYEGEHKMFYVTNVPKGTHIPLHPHSEDVFRYILTGSLVINANNESFRITQGMWFVIKKNTPYEVKTDEGYTALAGYRFMCETARR
jgi:quercetin dioxygenase-like cupin family protein